ncbi:MAG: MerR family transcriptional regulator [Deltaproteobacteria bacterium]|nr:MerR family transcriptional regulator [Deltaproteobacteria bacterium]
MSQPPPFDPHAFRSEADVGDRHRIGELARRTGKTIRTLHFYEEMGLLRPVERTKGGFRLYGHDAPARVHWIERLKELGFSLAEIREFLDRLQDEDSGPATMASLRKFYRDKLQDTRTAMARLRSLERELEESLAYLESCAACPADARRRSGSACVSLHGGAPPPPLVVAIQQPPSAE